MTPLPPRLPPEPEAPFPAPDTALRHPDGLLAWGGDLNPQRLLTAYRNGIFPWYSPGEPILWWSPDPRTVLDTRALHLSRSTRRLFRRLDWTIHGDRDFAAVVAACAGSPRPGQNGTWITPEMQAAYLQLHHLGHAHSIEVRDACGALVGGIYGVQAGPVFCGESMFSAASGGSKLALAALCHLLAQHQIRWLDAQMHSPHLARLGARQIPRSHYLDLLTAPPSPTLPKASWSSVLPPLTPSDLA